MGLRFNSRWAMRTEKEIEEILAHRKERWNAYQREYIKRPTVVARRKAYMARPDVRAKWTAYQRAYLALRKARVAWLMASNDENWLGCSWNGGDDC